MQDYNVYNFSDLTNRADLRNASLILGNGASIAVDSRFRYNNLFDKACDDSILDKTSMELFKALETNDFELVMNKLRQACIINGVLNLDSHNVASITYDNLRLSLINTVKATHVQYSDVVSQIENISKFIGQFSTVISLNYDLLVYWAVMENNSRMPYKMKDCFSDPIDGNLGFNYRIDKFREPYQGISDPTLVFYPHGNLMLASDENNDEFKIRINDRGNLFSEIEKKWKHNYVPLFVSEGDSKQKLRAIRRSAYLNFVFENVLPSLGSIVIIYGWRLAQQEKHLIRKIFQNTGIEKVFVSIYCGNSDYQEEQRRISGILSSENSLVDIKFFDSESKHCWCNPD